MAKPRTAGSRMPRRSSTRGAPTAPVMPVRMTTAAVSEGMPPSFSTMPRLGAVADLRQQRKLGGLAPSANNADGNDVASSEPANA